MIFIANVAHKKTGLKSVLSVEAKDEKLAGQIIEATGLYFNSIKRCPSFELDLGSFGKAITSDELTEHIYFLGSTDGKAKFGPVVHLDHKRSSFTMAWSRHKDLRIWMKMQGVDYPYFRVKTQNLLMALLGSDGGRLFIIQ